MKISTKGRYGLRILLDLAAHQKKGPVNLGDISRRQGISEKYLWQVINLAKAAGLINSARGPKGGYTVAKPADKISLLDIISALEGPIVLVDCLDKAGSCDRSSSCVTREVWGQIEDNMKQTMSKITLQDLVDKQEARATGQASSYDI
ncbi:MAG: Rrf2 family transcriptional regulator [bacterium]|jgi:Rrf2 family cysteine metabolism transcriptional repressor